MELLRTEALVLTAESKEEVKKMFKVAIKEKS